MAGARGKRLYVLNAPVLTDYGDWRFEGPISMGQARELLCGGFVSAVGHPGAAALLSEVLGIEVPVNRIRAEMQPGDRALVLRVKQRLPEGTVLSAEEMRSLPFELALLTRLSRSGE
jgi:hypothetical protein